MSCGGCKNWVVKELPWDVPDGFGKCMAAIEAWEMTEWDSSYENKRVKEEYKGTMMCACDGSSYRADVYTKKDFFCAMESAA